MPGVNTVTAAIYRKGHPEVELVRGEGYHYFVFSGQAPAQHKTQWWSKGTMLEVYETESVMCPYFGDLPHAQWVEYGVAFAEKIKAANPGCEPKELVA